MKYIIPLLLFVVFLAANDTVPVSAVPVPSPVTVDGLLREDIWKSAPLADSFSRVLPASREAPNPTVVKVVYDREAIYIGISARTAPGVQPLSFGTPWEGERVELVLKPDTESTEYFLFSVSADGVMRKAGWFGSADCAEPLSFECKWESSVTRTSDGWTAELRIPYQSLFLENPPKPGAVWKCNFCRANGNAKVVYSALNPKFSGFHYPGSKLIFK